MIAPAATGYMNLAHIARTHGRKGEVIVRPCNDLPFLLWEGMQVWLTPPGVRGSALCRVRHIRPSTRGMIVSFEGVDTIDDAEGIVGKVCLAHQSAVDMTKIAQAPQSVLGATVTNDELGVLGTIVEVMQTKAHDVWVVDTPVGELLLPICDEVITQDEIAVIMARHLEAHKANLKDKKIDVGSACAADGQVKRGGAIDFMAGAPHVGVSESPKCPSSNNLTSFAAPFASSDDIGADLAHSQRLTESRAAGVFSQNQNLQGMSMGEQGSTDDARLTFPVRLISGLLTNEQVAALSFNLQTKDK